MAIDTKTKRLSIMNLGCPWRGLLPEPDGTIDQADRQQFLYLYGGITSFIVASAIINYEVQSFLIQSQAIINMIVNQQLDALAVINHEVTRNLIASGIINYEPRAGTTDQGIMDSVAVGVLPQREGTGGAIYDGWEARKHRELTAYDHWDKHEYGELAYESTRAEWVLSMNVGLSKFIEIRDFITSHKGMGIPFYFYDLEHNGFVYDATGVITTGRYLVRFVEETFGFTQYAGSRGEARFKLSFSVIEVD